MSEKAALKSIHVMYVVTSAVCIWLFVSYLPKNVHPAACIDQLLTIKLLRGLHLYEQHKCSGRSMAGGWEMLKYALVKWV